VVKGEWGVMGVFFESWGIGDDGVGEGEVVFDVSMGPCNG